MTNPETDRRAQWATALWEAAEQNTIAEWICCDPIDPKHGLCVAGGKALEMLRALIVDDPEAYKPAPLTTVALGLAAAVSVPPPAPRADDQAALRDRAAEAIRAAACPGSDCRLSEAECSEQRIQPAAWERGVLSEVYGRPEWFADAVLAVLPEPVDRATVLREAAGRYEEILASADTGQDPRYWTAVRDITLGLRRLADEVQQPDDGEGDELVCVDECGFCDACGYEPFDTPAEGWREAARFLRRTARDSGDRQGALHGARLIEAELRRIAEEAVDDPQPVGPCVAGEQQNETPEARRCGHTDIVYGRCVRFIDDHEGECVHEHQPAAGVRQDGAQQ